MQQYKEVFSSFSVDDLNKAKKFYGEVLGLTVEDGQFGFIIHMVPEGTVFVYPKENHEPATFTVLNLEVDNLVTAINELSQSGVKLEKYEGMDQDEQGISHGKLTGHGPDIAWFKDPAGNVISILAR